MLPFARFGAHPFAGGSLISARVFALLFFSFFSVEPVPQCYWYSLADDSFSLRICVRRAVNIMDSLGTESSVRLPRDGLACGSDRIFVCFYNLIVHQKLTNFVTEFFITCYSFLFCVFFSIFFYTR